MAYMVLIHVANEDAILADVEELHLDPRGRNLLCGAQQPLIEGTLPQAARYSEDSKRFSFHCSSPVSVEFIFSSQSIEAGMIMRS